MQLFLLGYILIEICEIFTVGKFPLNKKVEIVGTGNEVERSKLTLPGLHWRSFRIDRRNSMDSDAQCSGGISIT